MGAPNAAATGNGPVSPSTSAGVGVGALSTNWICGMSWLIGNPPSSPSTKGAKIQRPGPSSSHCPSLVRPTGRIVSPSPCLPTMANPVPGPARTFDCTRTLAVMASREGSGVSVAGTVVGVGDGAGVGVQVGTATGACCAWEADGAGAWACWRPSLDWPRPQPVRSAPATRIVIKPRSRCNLRIDRFMCQFSGPWSATRSRGIVEACKFGTSSS